MPDAFAELRHELAVANRILANEGIIDAFGHISVRNPRNPDRYFISRHRASELVEPSDILEMSSIPSRSCRRTCASIAKW
jgi:ribulose-5-phosphate 4-epimerase/fuculose-1-phosphate aldolase